MTITIEALAKLCDAEIIGGNAGNPITSAADIKSAGTHQVTVLNDPKYAKYLIDSKASACFMSAQSAQQEFPEGMAKLVSKNPDISFITAVNALHPQTDYARDISKHAAIADSVQLGPNIYAGAFVSIEADSSIGEGTEIHSGARIGRHVHIGKNCRIYANVVIYDNSQIGDDVIIHAGSIIGADGFGYKQQNDKHIKVPHIGNIIIENKVEIGANSCIDRGTFGSTVIGAGTKIDNLVQIGHNNAIGENVIICGQSGISGSCIIENNAILAGSTGVADHVRIGHHAVVMARSGISGNVEPATQVWGSPAKDKKVAWRELAALAKLPELLKKVKALEEKISLLAKE
ncbi:MAG: UDP-3-O-(3-hydroxymyristoyl)glucosamine N-acyltransferase [Methylicorpusculum sp.]|uniref:UDP-3-O-(3-hydroxymyristoyl)glucosamine N-acyltransferase n=1 Tax=Methylicorpusculum sp. TaxID=2713644 RepID=UPI002727BF73|nr:UDP-3-O-(3-hydroxymyristoyl)glucosamine N-acyltransferase [Methylicorpusculum sp.]MDO8845018.1 UDP-3-O-(3-hydroxymyristoyl)glucosamine N-acyltransferase [Methylicorpusculum sp.]MDO8939996.1 UDP-3-O-(3-hydroxymyristoyl)glucosamine N-acyltransferase [Methylicorpusculum sp.]MDO9240374.1 UDP-3-O-(3-hydroxymyristoyl)glucosamine N-acyltransferase [Methylicorpusculum sp.]MDP2180421.1 UDP-3-O-(3-hydroxymyristoyl)glucosamine N-acyltransferase [Methylicorpusculum sp.]MDP2203124.1 UDP-3-O-(3-hydroxymy